MFLEFVEEQTILFIALSVVVAMLIYSYMSDKISGFKSVTADEAVRLYNQDAFVLDVRTAAEYKSGYIGEAMNLSSTELSGKMASIESHKDEIVLVYCQSGGRSAGSARAMVKAGFTNVHNLSGGILSWKASGLPLNSAKSKKKLKKEKKQ